MYALPKHMWVALTYTPIEVEMQDSGDLHTFTNETQDEAAREDAVLGCWVCKVPLTTANHDDDCSGDGDPKKVAGDLDKS